jgi:citrate lyase subunit beta/citryl-CoA lyase
MRKVLKQTATAGFGDRKKDKNDSLVTVTPGKPGSGIVINLQSPVKRQYGKYEEELIKKTVTDAGFADVTVDVQDNSAWDYTLQARVKAALERGIGGAKLEKGMAKANPNRGSKNELTLKATQRLRRSMMFVPGNSPKMINSADVYGADSLMFDIEDAIAVTEKDTARLCTAHALKALKFNCETVVRINHPTQTPYGLRDLEVICDAKPNLIRLPKIEDISEIDLVTSYIEAAEKKNGWPAGTINIIGAIESVKGLYNVREMCKHPRMVAIALGAEDFIANIKTNRTLSGIELYYCREQILMAARDAEIACLDTVFSDVKNMEGFNDETNRIHDMGFDGKSCIHPKQITAIHKIFTPTDVQIAKALKVLDAFEDSLKHNKGVLAVDGKMIDKPIVVRAQRVVNQAKAAGVNVESKRGLK